MTNQVNWPALLTVGIVFLLLGGIIGAVGFSTTKTVTEVVKVNVPVEVIKEVEKEVIKEVPAPSVLDQALATFLKAVEDEEDEAGNELDLLLGYDFSEVSVNKVYEEYTVLYDKDKTIVEFQVKLKYKEDGEKSEKGIYNVIVTFEEDEDTIISGTGTFEDGEEFEFGFIE